jgi:dihydrofolate reductase
MGRLIISTQITLDGVMTVGEWFNKNGEHDWHRSAGEASIDQLRAADVFLLGRKNYEGLSSVWPTMTDDVGFADRVNSMPKYVASRTLRGPLKWNSTLLEGDLKTSVTELKKRIPGNLLGFGCGDFAYQLVTLGLVDELRFWVNPTTWGEGERPFVNNPPVRMSLIGTTAFDTGVVLLSYKPAIASE